MTEKSDKKEVEVSLPFEWAIKETLGPTLDVIGVDLANLYEKSKVGVTRIAIAAKNKIAKSPKPIKDDAVLKANPRIARDVFWNGSFNEEMVSAEYFGGVLAQSRSENGKDDGAIFYLDIIKSLSSTQLLMHYLVYSAINNLAVTAPTPASVNPADNSDINNWRVYINTNELTHFGINLEQDIQALFQKGLISNFKYGPELLASETSLHVTSMTPTTLGIQLYAVASNELRGWKEFGNRFFDNFEMKESLKSSSFLLDDVSLKF